MSNPPKLRVAIVGAGIGGLTFASAACQMDHGKNLEIHIYEATPELAEIGAGLTIWYRTWELMRVIGCQETVGNRAFASAVATGKEGPFADMAFQYRKSDQKEGFSFLNLTVPGGTRSIHRADLHQALLEKLGEDTQIHLSSRVIACKEHGNTVTLEFQDGKTADFDLVAGADGIKSVVRKELLTANFPNEKDGIEPMWTGTAAYRGLIPREVLERESPGHRAILTQLMYCGKNKHIVVYPVSMGRLINVVAFFSEPEREGEPFPGDVVQEVSREEVLAKFDGWEDEVTALLKCIDKPVRWAILVTKPLSAYASRRVALLGDAAHAMTPHLGSGAGQAMEDGYILASVINLGIQEGISIAQMTRIYSFVRQPMGNFVLTSSRNQGLLYEFNSAGMEDVQENEPVERIRLAKLAGEIVRGWNWIWKTSVQEDQKRAMALL